MNEGGAFRADQDGEWLRTGGNIIASVLLCLIAVWLGHVLAPASTR